MPNDGKGDKDSKNSQGDSVYDEPKKEIEADYSAVKVGK